MQTVDMAGARLDSKLFIKVFRDVVKLSPPRFLALRIHPDTYKELYILADVPESIQVGFTPGMLGRMILKVNCIKPPLGVSDGIIIIQDVEVPTDRMIFEIHGIPEYIVTNLAINESPT
jgi:hypothetical protein